MTDLARIPATTNAALLDTLREQIAPEANDLELAYFGEVSNRLGLSVLKGEIALIGRWDSKAKRKVHRPQITVAGRRVLADRTGQLIGIEGPVWCGPREFNSDGTKRPLEWTEVWDDDDNPPYAARVRVHRRGWISPANGTCKWADFAQYDGDTLGFMWKKMPSHMLGKTAESLALRRGFPDVIPQDVDGVLDETAVAEPAVDRPPAPRREPTERTSPAGGQPEPAPNPPPKAVPPASAGHTWANGTPMFDETGKPI